MSLLLSTHLGLNFLEFFLGVRLVAAAAIRAKSAGLAAFSHHPAHLHEAGDALADPVAFGTDAGQCASRLIAGRRRRQRRRLAACAFAAALVHCLLNSLLLTLGVMV
eukprot:CAMPEP_0194750358 /NCGR_PEP_ID=MMETSP0323_2-20130528/4418_1 /TAXON_ID=2866 ORGANISM="Crypthecodinium cohnii, Strain Seligo" /NCGR_SAMPLE_ID=MMETSP0323_2 /ASSEMBLY_ACC=CAM_ASM_000346 /LENGTH=106 /DNA_ID=CAMNT_0039666005 /DNA_START=457 /DNA_END=777 /DNA_ORIENTATION=+